jgi:hypothetical protein
VDLSLDDVLNILKLLTGVGIGGKRRCPDAGLACAHRSTRICSDLGSARVTISIDSINMLADLQRERCTGPAECISESTTWLRRQQLVEARWYSLSAGFLK